MFPRLFISISIFLNCWINFIMNKVNKKHHLIYGAITENHRLKGIESMWNDRWSIMKSAYFIIWFSLNNNFRFSIKWYSRAQKVIKHKYVRNTCSMETVQQNGRFTLFSSELPSNIYSILFDSNAYKRND